MVTNTTIKKGLPDETSVKAGYKQTELGVIPENWVVKTLGEIGKFKGGSGFPIKYQGKVESKYPFYKVSDMNNEGNQTFMRNSNNWINENTKKIIGANIFPKHTIVFAKIGAAIYLERKKILFMESCIDNNMMGFIFDEFQSDYRFLHYLFLRIQLGKLVSATALPSLNGKQIAELCFAFPKKKEQTAIATVLSDTDMLIERLEKLIAKKKGIKRGTMQQLLTGKKRLSWFSEKWEVTNLGKVVEFAHGRSLSKSDLNEEGTYKCIHYGQLFTTYKELIREVKSRTNKNDGSFYSRENDVLMPTSDVTPRGLATASCIKETGVILGGGILVIRLHPGYDGLYFSYFVTQNKISVLKLVKGSTVFHLYANDLATLEVCFPNFQEQIAITRVLSDMDAEIESLEQKRDRYTMLKQGMMQQLLTGRIRIYANN